MKYKRILLKLSGESLMGDKAFGIDNARLASYASEIKEIQQLGVEIAIVIGPDIPPRSDKNDTPNIIGIAVIVRPFIFPAY